MSNLCIIPAAAVEDDRLTPVDVRVLCAIGRHTNAESGEGAWASARRLSQESALARSTFFLAAKKLIELGYIRRVTRNGKTSVYDIVLQSKTLGVSRRKTAQTPVRSDRTPSIKEGVRSPRTPPVRSHRTPPVRPDRTLTSPVNDPKNVATADATLKQQTANSRRQENHNPPSAMPVDGEQVQPSEIAVLRRAWQEPLGHRPTPIDGVPPNPNAPLKAAPRP